MYSAAPTRFESDMEAPAISLGQPCPAAADPLRPVVFDTAAFEPRHRFDAWCARFGGLNDIILPRGERETFGARFAAWDLGPFAVTTSTTPEMRMLRGPRHAARDGLDHWVLRVARSGVVRTRLGDARHETRPRQPMLYSVADGFDGEWTAAEWTTLWIRRDAFPTLTAGLAALRPGPQPGAAATLLGDLILWLPEQLSATPAAEAPFFAEPLRAMVSALLVEGAAAPRADVSDQRLVRERVRRVIRDNLRSTRLTPARIARAVGVSRSGLYRILEAEGGVARHVQRIRLAAAHAVLSDPAQAGRSISCVARDCGFYDDSAFGRAFRRTYGCTARELRTAALLGQPVPGDVRAVVRPGDGLARLFREAGAIRA